MPQDRAGSFEPMVAPPLDPVHAGVLVDCIHAKVRERHVANRPIYVAPALTAEGTATASRARRRVNLWRKDVALTGFEIGFDARLPLGRH